MVDAPDTVVSPKPQFERLCARLEEYEHLPELAPGPSDRTPAATSAEHEDSIDAEILAGLVLP